MYTPFQYPDKVTQQQDGAYRWRCPIDKEYYLRGVSISKKIFLIIALCILAFGAYFYFASHSWEPLAIVAVCDAAFLLIAFGTSWLVQRIAKNPQEIYEMTDTYIRSGSGKYSTFISFDRVRLMDATGRYIELKARVLRMRVYVPMEDLMFVRNYISIHLPGDAEKRYV